ncbi:putative ATP-grasp-modified RiPP [Streptomyces orinoci]|uniref:ATP-grasp-modified RiPP n=1 Tax=Streptomyces orinoci TaxID=67339 RepID=A0ABV3JY72_STRON|nr:putative ATP-grasp-modified RiPP [Streptomyces orinoci]
MPDLVEPGALVISELVGNAVEHTGSQRIDIMVARPDPQRLRVAVGDNSRTEPKRRAATLSDENGRGLTVVAALATHWGSDPLPCGKRVWADLLADTTRDHPSNEHRRSSDGEQDALMNQTMRPWGLSRMEPYGSLTVLPGRAVALDPATQTAVYQDPQGNRVEMGKHGTGTGKETKTRTSQGDGSGPSNADEGHDQESDQD